MKSFSYTTWSEQLRSIPTFRSLTVPLPGDFIAALGRDGIYLESDSKALPKFTQEEDSAESSEEWATPPSNWKSRANSALFQSSWSSEEEEEKEEEEKDEEKEEQGQSEAASPLNVSVTFPQLVQAINEGIEKLGGAAFVKTNWKAPIDATWMKTDGTLKCTNAAQVLLLLQASDRVQDDLSLSAELALPPTLVLRKWGNLLPSSEYRCYVHSGELVAISQRDCTKMYESLLNTQAEVKKSIANFFEKHLEEITWTPDEYVFDVYVTREEKVYLVDFGIYPTETAVTSSLFSLEDLEQICELRSKQKTLSLEDIVFRVIEDEEGIVFNDVHRSHLPFELREATTTPETSAFLAQLKR